MGMPWKRLKGRKKAAAVEKNDEEGT